MASTVKEMDNYTVLKKIGAGGYGDIFVIKDKRSNKKYVAKRFHQKNKSLIEKQYTNLVGLGKKCRQYFVCPVGMIFQRNGEMFLLMDYLEGYVDLFDYIMAGIKNPEILTPEKAVRISKSLIRALRVMHSLDVVHRDIKPENIMINPKTLDVRFIDFGLACVGPHCQMEHHLVGTRGYLAPELLFYHNKMKSLSLDDLKRTDLFSLGLVIALLCNPGHVPVLPYVVKRYKFPNNTSFFMHNSARSILHFINKEYIQDPLKCTSINLLTLDPAQRTLGRVQCQEKMKKESRELKAIKKKMETTKRRKTI